VSGTATLGRPAPDFTLPSLDGPPVRLADHRGRIVVLEWINPDCPFVRAAHQKGSLKDMAARNRERVVWLAVNSGAPGKQGHGVETNRAGKTRFAIDHPILIDERGEVGRAYGARHTPHMFVVDREGLLVYRGAIDNTGSGDPEDASPLVNYVEEAIAAAEAGRPVARAETEAWGCSVKYAD
jgi:peroxiredoxin